MQRNILIYFLVMMGSLSAQSFSGKLNPYPSAIPLEFTDSIRILAVMADFLEDKDGSTFGNGMFGSIYSKDYGTEIIDPLPHDKSYFESHLEFVRNYFTKVSDGKLHISFTVLPNIVTLSNTMRNYSPPPRSEDLSPVADFAAEVWQKADEMHSNFPFTDYDVFFVFHAGVGRDVTLPGSLGLERDIPSVFLSNKALAEIYGTDFRGFPVNSGSFFISNTGILPETESRELSSLGGDVLFELSINGLLVATVASYLGLPDLFDTETGLSAIGRFGLMDGQSIFAYNGLFPPQPSAWEKYFLGWVTPSEADLSINNYSLVPSFISEINDTSILKVNLSSSEYFLLENRQRDVNNDGSLVSYLSSGEVRTKVFDKDTAGYYSYDVDSLKGVIIDIDEYDWALPGSGIVIWHIDENIIKEKLTTNNINSDSKNRGVDVEEADGIQDIGVEFQTIFGDVVIGEGEQRDFWYASNDADLYQNRFSVDTRPNTMTNSEANSLLTISDFSESSNRMTFRITYGDSIIKPVISTELNISPDQEFSIISIDGNNFFNSPGMFYFVSEEGNIIDSIPGFSAFKPAAFRSNDSVYVMGISRGEDNSAAATKLNTFIITPSGERVYGQDIYNFFSEITSNPVFLENGRRIVMGADGGKIYDLIFNIQSEVYVDSLLFPGIGTVTHLASDGDYISAIARKGSDFILIENLQVETPLDIIPDGVLLTKHSDGEYVTIVSSSEKIIMISNGELYASVQKETPGPTGTALTDLKRDGNNYIAFNDGDKIRVCNLNGYSAENFPFYDPLKKGFDRYILAVDFEGSGASEIIAVTVDGRIYAIDGSNGKIVGGFPISAGSELKSYPVLHNDNNATYLSVLNSVNLFSWSISSVPGNLFWSGLYGNNANTSFIDQADNSNRISRFFPTEKVYNYPNPVYDGKTYIRYYVTENSRINIKIFDLAGTLVEELNSEAAGGIDSETEWNVSVVQSGIYFARVEALSPGGKSETKIIKIAVVK